jgi:hypothetical protein
MTYQIKTVHLEGTTSIGEDTPIVRYMKLETLLLMLEGGYVFIPSYAKLGQNDPLEMNILLNLPDRWKFWEKYADKLEPRFVRFRSDLIVNGIPAWHRHKTKAELVRSDFGYYVDHLAGNRCVWCWNKFRNFSYALWQIYGIRGVAVRSTVRLVKAALLKAAAVRSGAVQGIVGPISYIDHEGERIPEILT